MRHFFSQTKLDKDAGVEIVTLCWLVEKTLHECLL